MRNLDPIFKALYEVNGNVSFLYKNLITGEVLEKDGDIPLKSASVIKLFIMAEAFRQMEEGILSPDEVYVLKERDKVPPSGVLVFLKEGLTLTVMDLVKLMIVVSDNVATNVLTDLLGREAVNGYIKSLGYTKTFYGRKMFDSQGKKEGLENFISTREVGDFLERLYRGRAVSPKSDRAMVEILKNQQVFTKFPCFMEEGEYPIAHKTGEDEGISHDVGIFYTKTPFILCICANELKDVSINMVMGQVAKDLAQIHEK